MATTIKLKNGSGAPLAGDLVQGEPAFDLTNKRLYTENASGTVIEVGTNPSTIDINAGTIDGTVIGGASAAAGTFTTFTSTGIDDNATSTAITIDSSQNVGIGTASPGGAKLRVAGDLRVGENSAGSTAIVALNGPANTISARNAQIEKDYDSPFNFTITSAYSDTTPAPMLFKVRSNEEAMRIDSSGNVGIGTSSPNAKLDVVSDVNPASTDTFGSLVVSATASAFGQKLNLAANSTDGNCSIYSVNRGVTVTGLKIQEFGGTTTFGGNVGIGTASPNYPLEISSSSYGIGFSSSFTATPGTITFTNGSNRTSTIRAEDFGSSLVLSADTQSGNSSTKIAFETDGSERMRIDSSGNLLVGTTDSTPNSMPSAGMFVVQNTSATYGIHVANNVATNQAAILFSTPSGAAGQINTLGTTTSYLTSSDYRLKENVVNLDNGIDRLKQIPVHRFNFISNPDTTVDGFMAHEVQDVVPEAISGTKDAVDAEGNPEYQGIDQSKLVPLLTAALQEAVTRIETLEAEVAALKGA